MIKFTIIFVIVYFVLWILTKIDVEGASADTVDILKVIKPVYNFKAGGE